MKERVKCLRMYIYACDLIEKRKTIYKEKEKRNNACCINCDGYNLSNTSSSNDNIPCR